jgi:hypothetical protein
MMNMTQSALFRPLGTFSHPLSQVLQRTGEGHNSRLLPCVFAWEKVAKGRMREPKQCS